MTTTGKLAQFFLLQDFLNFSFLKLKILANYSISCLHSFIMFNLNFILTVTNSMGLLNFLFNCL